MPVTNDNVSSDAQENPDEDHYFDGPYLVFTAAYHLKRGFCCQSGCRHCPYGSHKDSDVRIADRKEGP